MQMERQDLPALVKEVRRQLSLSQEGLARELGVGFTTVNRWENSHVRVKCAVGGHPWKPSKIAKYLAKKQVP